MRLHYFSATEWALQILGFTMAEPEMQSAHVIVRSEFTFYIILAVMFPAPIIFVPCIFCCSLAWPCELLFSLSSVHPSAFLILLLIHSWFPATACCFQQDSRKYLHNYRPEYFSSLSLLLFRILSVCKASNVGEFVNNISYPQSLPAFRAVFMINLSLVCKVVCQPSQIPPT